MVSWMHWVLQRQDLKMSYIGARSLQLGLSESWIMMVFLAGPLG